jgi:hypothetical protein
MEAGKVHGFFRYSDGPVLQPEAAQRPFQAGADPQVKVRTQAARPTNGGQPGHFRFQGLA